MRSHCAQSVVVADRAMVLTRSAQPMRTRSKGRAPEETKFTMLPAKRKHRTRHDTVKDPDEAALPSPTKCVETLRSVVCVRKQRLFRHLDLSIHETRFAARQLLHALNIRELSDCT